METMSPLVDKKTRMRFNKALREKGVAAKACGKCFVVKGHGAFSVVQRATDGRNARCKACIAGDTADYYARNRDQVLERNAAYVEANKDRVLARNAAWRRINREHLAARKASYYVTHRKEILRQRAEYYADNREAAAERNATWRRAHPERKAELTRRWNAENPDKRRLSNQKRRATKAAAAIENFTARDMYADWEEHDLWECFYCAGPLDNLHIEHFEALENGGAHALHNLVPSCAECNLKKGTKEAWGVLAEHLAARGVDLDACLSLFDDEPAK